MKYRNDMGRLITTISVITNRKIPEKFEFFVKSEMFKNINAGTFEKCPKERSFYKQKAFGEKDSDTDKIENPISADEE